MPYTAILYLYAFGPSPILYGREGHMSLIDNIRLEQSKLQAERDQIKERLVSIEAEANELDIALRVAERLGEHPPPAPSVTTISGDETPDAQDAGTSMTYKELARQILKDSHPEGLQAREIREIAAKLYLQKINSNTLTVSLGRLKNDGHVRIDGRTWFWLPPSPTMDFPFGKYTERQDDNDDAPPSEPSGASDLEGAT